MDIDGLGDGYRERRVNYAHECGISCAAYPGTSKKHCPVPSRGIEERFEKLWLNRYLNYGPSCRGKLVRQLPNGFNGIRLLYRGA